MDRIVGLDIGTTKICAIIAEVEDNGLLKITGVGSSPSDGLKRGVVVNVEKTVQSIRTAIEDAQQMSGTRIDSVYAGIAGDHIRSVNTRAVVAVSGPDNEITPNDEERVIEAAKAVSIPMDREIVHVLPQSFVVDDQPGIKDPIGMSGVRLEADVHIVTGAVTSAQNICKSIRRAGVEVVDLVLEPIASSYAVLTPDEEEMGVALVDVGGGTSDLAVFYDGSIRHTAVVGLGGTNVTHDVAIGLRTPWKQAEAIKREYGCALQSLVAPDDIIEVPGVAGRPSYDVQRGEMAAIIEARMEEIFGLVHREIRRTDYANLLAAGVVITGGGSMLEGCAALAEEVFGLPVTVGSPRGVTGLVDAVCEPLYATGVGLVQFGLHHRNRNSISDEEDFFDSILGRMKNWVQNFF
ncbi:MAG: cell division protein FtsA [Candidatus Latescibacteria bacterium]|jgi:cell division protein FtsA|nr:cell division protein FtsA [Candidatus Latescibacterota bacterium]